MKKFEILEHTADLKIKAFGKDKKELFENTMIAMFEGARYEAIADSEIVRQAIKVYSHDLSSLLVDFLSEVLYLSEVNQEVYDKVEFEVFDVPSVALRAAGDARRVEIEAILIGKKLKTRGVLIKGVTYHDLKIYQLKDKTWEAVILFDI